MIIKCHFPTLKQIRWYEYAVRFLVGGLITAVAGFIAKAYGPVIGGLFLAFPAIFPACATLIAKHEREKKASGGFDGEQRGISAAAVNAAGAAMGSIGLVVFAGVVWGFIAAHQAALVLSAATIAWFFIGCLAWLARRARHRWGRMSKPTVAAGRYRG